MHQAGPGQRQAVVGTGAPADLVQQHQAVGGGVVQDIGGLGHFHHEGGAPAGHVVGSADAGEDAVDRPQARAARRHVAAGVRQQHDQRHLAHVGGLAAHVRAGDQQDALRVVQRQVVVDERTVGQALDHRVPAAVDGNARRLLQLRLDIAEALRPLGQVGQRVQLRQRGGRRLQRRQLRQHGIQQLLEQLALACQGPFAGTQRLVLERLQFRCQVALGVLERLPARVVGRQLRCLGTADLDVVAVHPVVADLQVGDAGTRPLALLQLQQVAAGIATDGAQFVEVGIEAGGDDAAVAQQGRRLCLQRSVEHVPQCGEVRQIGSQRGEPGCLEAGQRLRQRRQQRQAVTQRGQVARTRRA